ncbi:MAG TPA: hypothetical protein VHE78_12940 [Gemmatimonadaceae bacterium]|nr:hypothetical protein [Gemmatimonadaceae bacterium]
MVVIYAVHIVAGSLALVFGYVALFAAKGAPLHRKSGMWFVYAILTMCFVGALIAAVRGKAPAINLPAASLTAYLVITGLTTVRPPVTGSRWLSPGLMLVGVAVGVTTLALGFQAVANGGARQGIPAFPFFMFAIVGLLGSAGDLRIIRSGAVRGAPRLARHLWRMCFALYIAAMSFFIGQAKVIPKPVRIYPLLAIPPLLALMAMAYWLWRVRRRGTLRGVVMVPAAQS